jgi:hypothetical protein
MAPASHCQPCPRLAPGAAAPADRRPRTAEGFLAQLEDANSELSRRWDQEYDEHVFDKLLAVVRPNFSSAP